MASASGDDGSEKKLLPVVSGASECQPRSRSEPRRRVVSTSERIDSLSDNDDAPTNVCMVQGVFRNPERVPLIRPRRPDDDQTDDVCSVSRVGNRGGYGATGARTLRQSLPDEPKASRAWRCLDIIATTLCMRSTSVMAFLLILVFGVALTFTANIKTHESGIRVEPRYVLVYTMILMIAFMVWVFFFIFLQSTNSSSKNGGALIPSHLLTGIGIFGTITTISQMLSFVDVVKCSRHIKRLSVVYFIYPFLKSLFVYFQIYFFYKLSRDGIRDRKIPGGNFFVMVTLAANMCMWSVVFIDDASNDPKMINVSWLDHYYYGVRGYDPCANYSANSTQAKLAHDFITSLNPYIAAFSMEYTLLASGLLLHIWTSMKTPFASRLCKFDRQEWTLWRAGFICGALALPFLFAGYISEASTKNSSTASVILYAFESIIYVLLAFFSRRSTIKLNKAAGFVKNTRSMPIEVVLLGISIVGFPILDLSCVFASIGEVRKLPFAEVFWYGVSSVFQLISVGSQFLFIMKVYELKVPEVADEEVRKTARFIRQFASFALVVSVGYWAAETYEIRRPINNPIISEKYFGNYAWFAITHLAYPLCIFFHFHLAICYADVIFFFSQFGPQSKLVK